MMVRGRFLAVSSQTKLHTAVVDNKEEIYCLEMIEKALKWSQSRSFTTMVVVSFVLCEIPSKRERWVCLVGATDRRLRPFSTLMN